MPGHESETSRGVARAEQHKCTGGSREPSWRFRPDLTCPGLRVTARPFAGAVARLWGCAQLWGPPAAMLPAELSLEVASIELSLTGMRVGSAAASALYESCVLTDPLQKAAARHGCLCAASCGCSVRADNDSLLLGCSACCMHMSGRAEGTRPC